MDERVTTINIVAFEFYDRFTTLLVHPGLFAFIFLLERSSIVMPRDGGMYFTIKLDS